MGNLCGKQSEDPFAQPGRTVGSVPPPSNNQTASLPRKVGGPARTLGGSNAKDTGDISPEEARKRAAAAAEVSLPFLWKLYTWSSEAVMRFPGERLVRALADAGVAGKGKCDE